MGSTGHFWRRDTGLRKNYWWIFLYVTLVCIGSQTGGINAAPGLGMSVDTFAVRDGCSVVDYTNEITETNSWRPSVYSVLEISTGVNCGMRCSRDGYCIGFTFVADVFTGRPRTGTCELLVAVNPEESGLVFACGWENVDQPNILFEKETYDPSYLP